MKKLNKRGRAGIDVQNIAKQIDARAKAALIGCGRAVLVDVKASQTIPFESGHLQNQATSLYVAEAAQGRVAVVTDAVYARRKYFHPEFNFNRSINKRASGRWFDTYANGEKRGMLVDAFVIYFKRNS